MEPEEGSVVRDCWSVSFGDAHSVDDRCLVAGYDNGDVKLFDLAAGKLRWETNVSNGVCGVEFDRKDIEMNKLVISTLESRYRLYDMRTHHPVHGYSFLSQARRTPTGRTPTSTRPQATHTHRPHAHKHTPRRRLLHCCWAPLA